MAEVKVLVEGKHSMLEGKKLSISSTVTLIKTDKNILIDTGAFVDREKIIESLKKENLTPQDIEVIILTHLHLDHLMNLALFNKSKVYCKFKSNYPGQMHNISEGYLERFDLLGDAKIGKGINIISTPGHSLDMVSVVVDTDNGKVVIAGDSLPNEDWVDLKKQPLEMLVYDVDEFNKSRKKILEIANYIIPGHGKMFEVKK